MTLNKQTTLKKYYLFFVIIFLFFLINPSQSSAVQNDKLYLIDQAGIFSQFQEVENKIIQDLTKINQKIDLELYLLTIKSANKNTHNYCTSSLRTTITQTKNQKIIIIYSQNQNRLFACQTADSLMVTEDEFYYIFNELVQPNIDNNNLFFALKLAIKEVGRAIIEDKNIIPKDYQKQPLKTKQTGYEIIIWLLIIILFSWLAAVFGKTKAWWLGGIIGFGLGLFIWFISKIWFFMPLFLFSGLLYDYIVSRHHLEYCSGKKGSFWCLPSKKK